MNLIIDLVVAKNKYILLLVKYITLLIIIDSVNIIDYKYYF